MLFFMAVMMAFVVWRGATNPDATISTVSTDLKRGQELFEKHCQECHFPKEGIPLKGPVLGFFGQEYRLTDRQLVEAAKGKQPAGESAERRDLTDEERQELEKLREIMRKTTAKLSKADTRNVIAFLKKSWSSDAQLEHWVITHQPPGQ
jgi:mono/diheme cytochrome c family protein